MSKEKQEQVRKAAQWVDQCLKCLLSSLIDRKEPGMEVVVIGLGDPLLSLLTIVGTGPTVDDHSTHAH